MDVESFLQNSKTAAYLILSVAMGWVDPSGTAMRQAHDLVNGMVRERLLDGEQETAFYQM